MSRIPWLQKISGNPCSFKASAAIRTDGFSGFEQVQIDARMPCFFAVSVATRLVFMNEADLIMRHVILLSGYGSGKLFHLCPTVFLRIFLKEEERGRVLGGLQAY